MTTDFKSIPLIDIAPLVEKWDDPNIMEDNQVKEVVRQLDVACREVGFFYVNGHGIPDDLLKEVRSIAREFFHMPYEEKLKIKLSAATGFRGYSPVGENLTNGVPNMSEAIDCFKELKSGMYGGLGDLMAGPNAWPSDPPNFKKLMEEYINLCTDMSRKIMRGIALALGAPVDAFEGNIAGDPFWVTRIIGYPVLYHANGKEIPENDSGCGVHTDYGLLAIINQDDDITALEVKNLKGEWVPAVPIPGTFVCNIGDMLKILTNGIYESTLHKVINKSQQYRVCLGYFYEPNFDSSLEPMDMCVKKTGGAKKFEAAVYGKHLIKKVNANFQKLMGPFPLKDEPNLKVSHSPMPLIGDPNSKVSHSPMPLIDEPNSKVLHSPIPLIDGPNSKVFHSPIPIINEPKSKVPHSPIPIIDEPKSEVVHSPIPIIDETKPKVPHSPIPIIDEPKSKVPHSPTPIKVEM